MEIALICIFTCVAFVAQGHNIPNRVLEAVQQVSLISIAPNGRRWYTFQEDVIQLASEQEDRVWLFSGRNRSGWRMQSSAITPSFLRKSRGNQNNNSVTLQETNGINDTLTSKRSALQANRIFFYLIIFCTLYYQINTFLINI